MYIFIGVYVYICIYKYVHQCMYIVYVHIHLYSVCVYSRTLIYRGISCIFTHGVATISRLL